MHGSTVYYAWPFSDSDAASPQQTQTNNDASGSPQRVAGRPPLPSVQVTVLHLTKQKALGRPLRPRIQAINGNAVYWLQKITANGLVRRGRPEAFLARQVPTSGRRRTVAKTDSCGWRPAYEMRP